MLHSFKSAKQTADVRKLVKRVHYSYKLQMASLLNQVGEGEQIDGTTKFCKMNQRGESFFLCCSSCHVSCQDWCIRTCKIAFLRHQNRFMLGFLPTIDADPKWGINRPPYPLSFKERRWAANGGNCGAGIWRLNSSPCTLRFKGCRWVAQTRGHRSTVKERRMIESGQ